jgi:hypothetical protein
MYITFINKKLVQFFLDFQKKLSKIFYFLLSIIIFNKPRIQFDTRNFEKKIETENTFL